MTAGREYSDDPIDPREHFLATAGAEHGRRAVDVPCRMARLPSLVRPIVAGAQ
jgi:hypothetical protein